MSRRFGDSKFFLQILPILAPKKADSSVSTADLEARIDKWVYELYDLNTDEIAMIEKAIL